MFKKPASKFSGLQEQTCSLKSLQVVWTVLLFWAGFAWAGWCRMALLTIMGSQLDSWPAEMAGACLHLVPHPPGHWPWALPWCWKSSVQQEDKPLKHEHFSNLYLPPHLLFSHWPKQVRWPGLGFAWEESNQRCGHGEGNYGGHFSHTLTLY